MSTVAMRSWRLGYPLVVLGLSLTGARQAQAADYYVSPSGTATNPGTLAQPWSLAKANATLTGGSTAYLLAGTYNTGIKPTSSGAAGSPIVYRSYQSDVVTISGVGTAIDLTGRSYVTVDGINAASCGRLLYIRNGSHNIVAHGELGPQSPLGDWEISVVDQSSQYNWLHHLEFHDSGVCTGSAPPNGVDEGSVLDIGRESSTDASNFNLIEDNVFYHGGHHVVALHTGYNTFRNNYIHNEGWSNGAGNRNLYLNNYAPLAQSSGQNVIEGNRFGFAAKPCDMIDVGNVAMSTSYNLFRHNSLFHSNAYALGLYSYGDPNSQGSYNHVYNNTMFNAGIVNAISPELAGATYPGDHAGINIMTSRNKNNSVRNNLFYATVRGLINRGSNNDITSNWDGNTLGDPKFANASTTPGDPFDATLPNLRLQAGSPAVDQGRELTTVAAGDTGAGTALVVTDSLFFQDGTFATPGTVQADWLAVGTVTNTVQISSIDHAANTITLRAAITRQDGDPVWLFKKSDGAVVLVGSQPDAGAFELSPGLLVNAPSAPRNLIVR
ncbi:MAG: hypothetical protein HY903_06960 [Deltaproteobacteria bacterium]|nr:hypothetical protein [Deltaproteobacteria bacterium]